MQYRNYNTVVVCFVLVVSIIDNRVLNFLDVILWAIAIDKNVTYFTERKNG